MTTTALDLYEAELWSMPEIEPLETRGSQMPCLHRGDHHRWRPWGNGERCWVCPAFRGRPKQLAEAKAA